MADDCVAQFIKPFSLSLSFARSFVHISITRLSLLKLGSLGLFFDYWCHIILAKMANLLTFGFNFDFPAVFLWLDFMPKLI